MVTLYMIFTLGTHWPLSRPQYYAVLSHVSIEKCYRAKRYYEELNPQRRYVCR